MKRPLAPASRLGWWAFWLCFATVVWGRLFLALPALLGPRLEGGQLRIPLGFGGAVLELLLAAAAVFVGIIAMRKGQRPWMVLVAFGAAVLVGGFWSFFAAGELLSPH